MANRTNPIYLNAGDNFQGTFWYNVGRWNVTSYFLNLLPADAFVSFLYIVSIAVLFIFKYNNLRRKETHYIYITDIR